jgi:hypothetical protein
MDKFLNTCLFDKVIPNNDIKECSNHRSIGAFTQGIFSVSSLDVNKYWKIHSFLEENKDKIAKIECYLLKHPLFSFPVEFYPYFIFLHHAQIGFKFIDKNGNTIRHFILQLQPSNHPSTSNTKPFDLPTTCKVVDVKDKNNNNLIIHLDDKTAIYGDLLESDNGISDRIIEMNKYIYFQGIRLSFLQGTVNFNFFLDSYRMWRQVNNISTSPSPTSPIPIPDDIRLIEKSNCNQKDNNCGGSGDGSLFVFSGFGPAFLSQNEGCILHFATISSKTNNENNVTQQFNNFIKWTFSNFQCYNNIEAHSDGYAKHYITLSPSSLNYNWCLEGENQTDVDNLFSQLRPNNGAKAGWLSAKDWDSKDPNCVLFDKLIDKMLSSKSFTQPANTPDILKDGANVNNCPFLCFGENYTCETYSRMLTTMILNDKGWSSDNDVQVEQLFDFTFNDMLEGDMSFVDNLYRAFAAYWPVAVFDDGYENGVKESIFNTDKQFEKDKILYARQAQLFKYIFNSELIEASKVTQNPIIMVLAAFLGVPKLQELVNLISGKDQANSNKNFRSITNFLTGILYALFLYSFLGIEEVFIPGYPVRKMNTSGYTFEFITDYDCEPSIYKFQIGKSSRAGIANNKCVEALFKWITKDSASDNSIFSTIINVNKDDDDITKKIKEDLSNAINEYKAAYSGKDDEDPKTLCKDVPTDLYSFCSQIVEINNTAKDFKHIMMGNKDVISAVTLILENPVKFAKIFAVAFYNFVEKIAGKIFRILTVDIDNFATLSHQNYTYQPQIMVQRIFDLKTPYNFLDFRRPTDGICSDLKCNIDINNKPTLRVANNIINSRKFTAQFKLINPYKDANKKNYSNTGFHVTLILCIILFLFITIFLGIRVYKKLKNKF